jgi:hypothetical protein
MSTAASHMGAVGGRTTSWLEGYVGAGGGGGVDGRVGGMSWLEGYVGAGGGGGVDGRVGGIGGGSSSSSGGLDGIFSLSLSL